jgi:hypothetical protein
MRRSNFGASADSACGSLQITEQAGQRRQSTPQFLF